MERLEPRVRVVWIAVALIRSLFLGVFVVGGAYTLYVTDIWEASPVWIVWGALAFVIVVTIFRLGVAWRRYTVFRFELRDQSLYIERGVFTRIKTVVPYVRVQHVDSRRSPLERAAGLATLVVYTAGSRSADVAIPGLTPERSEELQEQLRQLTIESEGEDAV